MTMFNSWKLPSPAGQDRFLQKGPFTLDLFSQRTLLEEKYIQLPPCTFDYLVTLLRHSPMPVSYQQLVNDSQGYELPRLEAQDLARMRIYTLRKALEDSQEHPCYIQAVAGFGYRLVA